MMSSTFRVVRNPEWRVADDGNVDLLDPRHDRWIRIAAWSAKLLTGIEQGENLHALVARLNEGKKPRKRREARARRFVFNLARLGYVDVPLERPEVYAGRYRFLRELGRGGMGVADLCRHEETGDEVVVKYAWDFLKPRTITEAATRREATVLERLAHPGIARRLDAFEENGRLHVVREFARGPELGSYHRDPLGDRAENRRLAAAVADIVGHIHERGMLLVDLRPANFIRREGDGRVMLIDVGQCHDAPDGEIRLEGPVGSPGFTSPEMAASYHATRRSDVWGLGRLYFFLATGELPPREGGVSGLEPHLDADDATTVRRLSADAPEDRPATMAEAARLLTP